MTNATKKTATKTVTKTAKKTATITKKNWTIDALQKFTSGESVPVSHVMPAIRDIYGDSVNYIAVTGQMVSNHDCKTSTVALPENVTKSRAVLAMLMREDGATFTEIQLVFGYTGNAGIVRENVKRRICDQMGQMVYSTGRGKTTVFYHADSANRPKDATPLGNATAAQKQILASEIRQRVKRLANDTNLTKDRRAIVEKELAASRTAYRALPGKKLDI